MIWLRISITSLFLFAVLYFQFFFDFNSILDQVSDDVDTAEIAKPEDSLPSLNDKLAN